MLLISSWWYVAPGSACGRRAPTPVLAPEPVVGAR